MLVSSFQVGTLGGNLSIKNAHPEFTSDVFVLLETVGATLTISKYDLTKGLFVKRSINVYWGV